MVTSGASGDAGQQRRVATDSGKSEFPLEHYLRVLLHRKWVVLGVWGLISLVTAVIVSNLPDIYMSETLILVDPQKVPEAYVKSTVTGDIRNRLGTLSQQILSTSRLQTIIERLNLYPDERKKMAREDVIALMKSDISVRVVSDFGSSQDLQAFRITYNGRDPRLVAQVANQLAQSFIDENLKTREAQATSTTDFLTNQLQETRRSLEDQETKLRDFRLKHVGEMPEQEAADLQLLGQVQSQLQLEGDAIGRAEQTKSYLQSMIAQAAPVVDLDDTEQRPVAQKDDAVPVTVALKAKVAALTARYTANHPDVRKLQRQIEELEAKEASAKAADAAAHAHDTPQPAMKQPAPRPAVNHYNPVIEAQLRALDSEIAKHKDEQQRLSKVVAGYRAKLDAIPIRQQEIAQLVRDYEISKAHYSQLLDKQLSAQTATQLEIRQKGEKFVPLDPAQPAEKPSRPNRILLNAGGSLSGLILGLVLSMSKEFFGMSVVVAQDLGNLALLGVVPIIQTRRDRMVRRKRILLAATSMVVLAIAACAIFLYRSHGPI